MVGGLTALRDSLKTEGLQFMEVEKSLLEEKKRRWSASQDEKARRYSMILPCLEDLATGKVPTTPQAWQSSWLVCMRDAGCGLVPVASPTRRWQGEQFPCQISLGICKLTLYSAVHLYLLFGLLVFPLLSVLYLVDGYVRRQEGELVSHVAISLGLLMFTMCLGIIVWHIDRISVLMQLDREIQELDKARERVLEQRVRIAEFAAAAQVALDFWLWRTLPCLDLLKEITDRLKDTFSSSTCVTGEVEQVLRRICELVASLQARLGSVEEWQKVLRGPADQGGTGKEAHLLRAFPKWASSHTAPGDLVALEESLRRRLPELKLDAALRPGSPALVAA